MKKILGRKFIKTTLKKDIEKILEKKSLKICFKENPEKKSFKKNPLKKSLKKMKEILERKSLGKKNILKTTWNKNSLKGNPGMSLNKIHQRGTPKSCFCFNSLPFPLLRRTPKLEASNSFIQSASCPAQHKSYGNYSKHTSQNKSCLAEAPCQSMSDAVRETMHLPAQFGKPYAATGESPLSFTKTSCHQLVAKCH